MSYDLHKANTAAFHAVAEVSRVLDKAIVSEQTFSVDAEYGADGSSNIRIRVEKATNAASSHAASPAHL